MCMIVNKLPNGTCPDVVKLDLKIISINYLVEVRKGNNLKAKQRYLKLI